MYFSSKEHKASLISDLMFLKALICERWKFFIIPYFINRQSEASEEDIIKV